MRFQVRVANDGSVWCVFPTHMNYLLTCWLFDSDQPFKLNFLGGAVAVKAPAWRKDSFRDAALHG